MVNRERLQKLARSVRRRARAWLRNRTSEPSRSKVHAEVVLVLGSDDPLALASRTDIEAAMASHGLSLRVLQPTSADTAWSHGLGARLVVCLGGIPPGFERGSSDRVLQVLGRSLSKPQQLLLTKREVDCVICLEGEDIDLRSLTLEGKVLRRVQTHQVGREVVQDALALGVGGNGKGKPLRHFRASGHRLIDVYMSTSRRANLFEKTLNQLIRAADATSHTVRLNVFVDQMDEETWRVLAPHVSRVGMLSTNFQLGLPFLFNLMLKHQEMVEARSESFADYVCYIQDDCLIANEQVYFDFMVASYEEVIPASQVGYVSGYYCSIHPGFELVEFRSKQLLKSDSIDGKNFMAPPRLLRDVGPLSWYFKDGERRGNPGPNRGSHFDLWQWQESPRALTKQGRVSLVIPGLCKHIAQSAAQSTWGNETSREVQTKRSEEGRIYKTRDTALPSVVEDQF